MWSGGARRTNSGRMHFSTAGVADTSSASIVWRCTSALMHPGFWNWSKLKQQQEIKDQRARGSNPPNSRRSKQATATSQLFRFVTDKRGKAITGFMTSNFHFCRKINRQLLLPPPPPASEPTICAQTHKQYNTIAIRLSPRPQQTEEIFAKSLHLIFVVSPTCAGSLQHKHKRLSVERRA